MDFNGELQMGQQRLEMIRNAVDNFGNTIKDYREKELLTLNELAERVGCSGSYIFRAEKGSRKVPVHMRVKILTKGLNWNSNEIECYLIETVKEYVQKDN